MKSSGVFFLGFCLLLFFAHCRNGQNSNIPFTKAAKVNLSEFSSGEGLSPAHSTMNQTETFFEQCGILPVVREKYNPNYPKEQQTIEIETLEEIAVNSKGILVGIRKPKSNHPDSDLYRSENSGKSWQKMTSVIPKGHGMNGHLLLNRVVAVGETFFLVDGGYFSKRTIFKSSDGGKNWKALTDVRQVNYLGEQKLSCGLQQMTDIYLDIGMGKEEEYYVSRDFGDSWIKHRIINREKTSLLKWALWHHALNRVTGWMKKNRN